MCYVVLCFVVDVCFILFLGLCFRVVVWCLCFVYIFDSLEFAISDFSLVVVACKCLFVIWFWIFICLISLLFCSYLFSFRFSVGGFVCLWLVLRFCGLWVGWLGWLVGLVLWFKDALSACCLWLCLPVVRWVCLVCCVWVACLWCLLVDFAEVCC